MPDCISYLIFIPKGEASYGYCAAKDEFYYGFEGHIIINLAGVISGYTFASANIDERDVLQDMTQGLRGLLIGDKGFIKPSLKEELAAQELICRPRCGKT